jgi:hypothetical protein
LSPDDLDFLLRIDAALEPLLEGIDDERGFRSALVADVHTDINTSTVLEEGVGYVELIVVAFPGADGVLRLAAGPVLSQYEFQWPLANRLTDEQWFEMLEKGEAPDPPAWTQSFRRPVVLPPWDSDHDQLPDEWEQPVWGGVDVCNEPGDDPDGDGQSNLAEYLTGTDPRRFESRLHLTVAQPAPAELTLEWLGNDQQRYRVFTSTDLHDWCLLGTPVVGDGEPARITDAAPSPGSSRFYRVQALPVQALP